MKEKVTTSALLLLALLLTLASTILASTTWYSMGKLEGQQQLQVIHDRL